MFKSQLTPEELNLLKTFYPSRYDVINGPLNENIDSEDNVSGDSNDTSSPKIDSFKGLEEFLKGKKLPYIKNAKADKNYSESIYITYGIVPLDPKVPMYTLGIGLTLDEQVSNSERKDSTVRVVCNVGDKKVDVNDFKGQAIINPDADFKSVYDIVEMCDYDRFFISYWRDALDYVSKRNPRVRSTFNNIDVQKSLIVNGRMATLYVYFDEIRRRFMMGYNPMFILAAALEEYSLYQDKYESFHKCYMFVLGFVISHEMLHIINHNTPSNAGILDTNSISPYVDNIFSDSYINISLSKIYRGMSGSAPSLLSNGIVDNFSLRSNLSQGGFKSFKSMNNFLRVIGDSVGSVVGIPKVVVSDTTSLKIDFDLLKGSAVYVNVYINKDSKILRETCASVMLVANTVLKNTIDGELHHSAEGFTEEEKKIMPIDEKADGLLLGFKVKDKATGKLGVVVSDVKGKLRIAFPDNPDLLDELVEDVKQNPKNYKGIALPDTLDKNEVI